jgi:hypothetical protein
MNRRQFLAGTVPTVSGLSSGCLGSRPSCTDESGWPPDVRVDDLELAPDDVDEFEIRADGITSFGFGPRLYGCGSTDAPVRFGDVDTTPSIDLQFDSCPPTWVWDDCTRVTVTVPVHVASDAEPGAYEYGFRIAEDIGERNSREYERAITIVED